MAARLETVPARHGTATFVPSGHTIKIINTYGKQVVSTWVFALNQPPDDDTNDVRSSIKAGGDQKPADSNKSKSEPEKRGNRRDSVHPADPENKNSSANDQPAADNSPPEASSKATETANNTAKADGTEATREQSTATKTVAQKAKVWATYLPSLKRDKQQTEANANSPLKNTEQTPEAQNSTSKGNSKKWSSYIPSGKGFSTYLPSKDQIATITAIHQRDPNASYAEQLYQFSKTPVGAAGISAATGSSTAQTLFAAYNAYVNLLPSHSVPPMEFMSLPHTFTGTRHIIPRANDTFLSNLRRPLLTIVEDTSAGNHDTLTAACDTHLYSSLGVSKPEEHNSCAVNLVLALNELNDKAGLKGGKRIGADITVNNIPTPLHLFMNAQYDKDGETKIIEPEGPKKSYVKFRAEVDIVVVMSACPMNLGSQNGGKCMAANFVVENENASKSQNSKPAAPERRKSRVAPPAGVTEVKEQGNKTVPSPSPEKKRPRKLERRSGDA